MDFTTKYRIPESIFLQEIDGETILLNSETGLYFKMNEIGATIWSMMKESETLGETFAKLLEIYDVESGQLEKDMLAFAETLKEEGLLEIDEKE